MLNVVKFGLGDEKEEKKPPFSRGKNVNFFLWEGGRGLGICSLSLFKEVEFYSLIDLVYS